MEYPKDRASKAKYPNGFDRHFMRALLDCEAGSTIGPTGIALVVAIVTVEDKKRFSAPVDFWTLNLLRTLGISEDALTVARRKCVEAGWLHYEHGTRGKAARYWVTIAGETNPQSPGQSPGQSLPIAETNPQSPGQSPGQRRVNSPDFQSYPPPIPKHTPQSRGGVCVDSDGKKNPNEDLAAALADVCGSRPKVKRAVEEFARVVSELAAAGHTAEKVREFGRRFWEVCDHARRHKREKPTAAEVAKWIDRMPERKTATRDTRIDSPAGKYAHLDASKTPEELGKIRKQLRDGLENIGRI